MSEWLVSSRWYSIERVCLKIPQARSGSCARVKVGAVKASPASRPDAARNGLLDCHQREFLRAHGIEMAVLFHLVSA